MNLFFIIWIVVATAVTFALVLWSLIEVIRVYRQVKSTPYDIKIMNKENVDEFIKSSQWHEHLQKCPGKKHSKCVKIIKND